MVEAEPVVSFVVMAMSQDSLKGAKLVLFRGDLASIMAQVFMVGKAKPVLGTVLQFLVETGCRGGRVRGLGPGDAQTSRA